MRPASALRRVGNKVYERAFPIYRPLYSAYKGYADRAERQLIRKMLFPGAVVADVGANIGVYSKFLAHCVGSTGVVHAFEPSPENFRRLPSATRNLSNVRLSQAAVGERTGRSQLYLSNELNVDHHAYPANGDSRRTCARRLCDLGRLFQVRRPSATSSNWISRDMSFINTLRGAAVFFMKTGP